MIWQGSWMKACTKVRNSIRSSSRRCSWCWLAQRGLTGSDSAHQALILQARAAMVMKAHYVRTRIIDATTVDPVLDIEFERVPAAQSEAIQEREQSVGGPVAP